MQNLNTKVKTGLIIYNLVSYRYQFQAVLL